MVKLGNAYNLIIMATKAELFTVLTVLNQPCGLISVSVV